MCVRASSTSMLLCESRMGQWVKDKALEWIFYNLTPGGGDAILNSSDI